MKIFNPDVLVLAGDITGYLRGKRTVAALGGMASRVLAVRGNSDLARVENSFSENGIQSLHLTTVEIRGIGFAGISGAIPVPMWTKFRWSEGRIKKKMEDLVNKSTILVTHPPPRGLRDEVGGWMSAGSKLLRTIVEKCQPQMVICGHIHERSGTSLEGDTVIVNCSMGRKGAGAIIDLEKGGDAKVRML